jgi:hypothetical protein
MSAEEVLLEFDVYLSPLSLSQSHGWMFFKYLTEIEGNKGNPQ